MKLSIVIICWNDLTVIKDCLESIYRETSVAPFEVIVSDNGSTDGSVPYIREHFPDARIVENGENVGFARGNNSGIRVAKGQYVFILNPDTIIRDRALDKLVAFADARPTSGAFGCRVLNPDGSYQISARPLPSVVGYLTAAIYLRPLARIVPGLEADVYYGWDGTTERTIGFQAGCCVMFRHDVLEQLAGFDERFFYHFEESDLCCRVWKSGAPISYCPDATITHLGGQSVGRFPIRFAIETYRSRYRYFYKHFGRRGATQIRWVTLAHLWVRRAGYSVAHLLKPTDADANRLEMYRVTIAWNTQLDPIRFVERGEEPELGYAPLAPAPVFTDSAVAMDRAD